MKRSFEPHMLQSHTKQNHWIIQTKTRNYQRKNNGTYAYINLVQIPKSFEWNPDTQRVFIVQLPEKFNVKQKTSHPNNERRSTAIDSSTTPSCAKISSSGWQSSSPDDILSTAATCFPDRVRLQKAVIKLDEPSTVGLVLGLYTSRVSFKSQLNS